MTSDSEPSPQQSPLTIGQQLGRYRVQRKLGAGGMAIVYEAEHVDLGKRCAIKILNPDHAKNPEIRARFLREGQAASRIGHRNVVDVYDVVSTGDVTYLVMEFLEGEDMGSFLEREGAISETKAADILVPVASALCRAHELGIVHRDIKPDNIFLVGGKFNAKGKGGEILPKVVDFGISKLMEAQSHELTQTSAMLGTPMYMSPEQARASKNVSAATDQYSLGVIAYQAVTGMRPFDGDTLYTLLHAIVSGDFAPPSSQVSIHSRFESLILRAMQNAPENRFPSMDAFGRALLPFASERIRLLYEEDFAPGGSADQTLHLPGSPDTEPGGVGSAETRRAPNAHPSESQESAARRTSLTESAATVAAVSGNVNRATGTGVDQASNTRTFRKWLLPATGLLGAVAVAASMAFSQRPDAEEPTEQPVAETGEAMMAPVEPPPPRDAPLPEPSTKEKPAPTPKTFSLASDAIGAHAFVEGVDRGSLPLKLEVPTGQQTLEFEVRAPGYQTTHKTWTEADGESLAIALQPTPQPPHSKPSPSAVTGRGSADRPAHPSVEPPPSAAETRPSAPLLAPR